MQVSFSGNQCCDNIGKGIYTHRSSGALGVAANGNIACRNGDEGMDLRPTVSTEVSGNQCYENGDIGLYVNSGNQMRVYENICRDNTGRGMILDGGGPLWLCLNEIHGNGQTGLRLQSVGRSHVFYNSVYSNGQNGVEANAAGDLINLNFNNIYGNYSSGSPEYYEILVNSSRAIDARRNYFGDAPDLDAYVYDRLDTGDDSVGFADVSGHAATYIPFPSEPTAMILDPSDAEVLNDGIAYRIGGIALSKTEPYTVQVSTDGGTTWTDIAGAASWTYDWTTPASGSHGIRARVAGSAAAADQATVTIDPALPTTKGRIVEDEIWNGATQGVIEVAGDITVDAGATLTIQAGTTVRFALSDDTQSGVDTSLPEIYVDGGALVVNGTEAEPVLFTTTGSVPAKGLWGGITVVQGAGVATPLKMSYATVEYAKWGLSYRLVEWNDPQDKVQLDNVAFRNTAGIGLQIQLEGGNGALEMNRVSAEDNGEHGIYIHTYSGGAWDADLVDIRCLSNGDFADATYDDHGLYWYNEGGSDLTLDLTSSPDADETTQTAFDANDGYGAYLFNEDSGTHAAMTVSKARFTDNSVSGLLVYGNDLNTIEYDISECEASGHTRTNAWNYGNGLLVYHYNRCVASGSLSNNTVSGNRYGIYQYNSYGNGSISTIIQNNTASANAERGINYYHRYGMGASIQIRGNIVSGTTDGHGIEVYRYSQSGAGELDVELDGNQSDYNNGKGIVVTYSSANAIRIAAHDNTCHDNAQEGLDLRCPLSAEIYSNASYLNGAAGLYVQSGDEMFVHQNNVYENAGNGIHVTGGGSLSLYLNEIHDNDGDGLHLASTAEGLVVFNDIETNDGDGLEIHASDATTVNYNNIHGNYSVSDAYEIRNATDFPVDARFNYVGSAGFDPSLVWDREDDIDVGAVNADFTSANPVAIPSDPVARITLPVDGETIKDNDRTVSGIAVSPTRPFTVQVSVDGGTTWNDADGSLEWSFPWTNLAAGAYDIRAKVVSSPAPPHHISVAVDPNLPTTSGTLSGDEVWDGATHGEILVTGDVVVPAGTSLAIQPGTTVKFAQSDDSRGGLDANKPELIVNGGAFLVNGTEAQPVVFTSDHASPEKGFWGGITVTQDGGAAQTVKMSHSTVAYATWGLSYALTGWNDPHDKVVLDHVNFVQIDGDGLAMELNGGVGALEITSLTSSNNSGRGVYAHTFDGGSWDASLTDVRCESNGGHGFYWHNEQGAALAFQLTSSQDADETSWTFMSANGGHGLHLNN